MAETFQQTIDNVVNGVKADGLFDKFRRECLEQFETMEAYQSLKLRVENHVVSFLSKWTYNDGLNKNTLRNNLRNDVTKSDVLLNGVQRLVDDVLNMKAQSFCGQIDEQVERYFDEIQERERIKLEEMHMQVAIETDRLESGTDMQDGTLEQPVFKHKPVMDGRTTTPSPPIVDDDLFLSTLDQAHIKTEEPVVHVVMDQVHINPEEPVVQVVMETEEVEMEEVEMDLVDSVEEIDVSAETTPIELLPDVKLEDFSTTITDSQVCVYSEQADIHTTVHEPHITALDYTTVTDVQSYIPTIAQTNTTTTIEPIETTTQPTLLVATQPNIETATPIIAEATDDVNQPETPADDDGTPLVDTAVESSAEDSHSSSDDDSNSSDEESSDAFSFEDISDADEAAVIEEAKKLLGDENVDDEIVKNAFQEKKRRRKKTEGDVTPPQTTYEQPVAVKQEKQEKQTCTTEAIGRLSIKKVKRSWQVGAGQLSDITSDDDPVHAKVSAAAEKKGRSLKKEEPTRNDRRRGTSVSSQRSTTATSGRRDRSSHRARSREDDAKSHDRRLKRRHSKSPSATSSQATSSSDMKSERTISSRYDDIKSRSEAKRRRSESTRDDADINRPRHRDGVRTDEHSNTSNRRRGSSEVGSRSGGRAGGKREVVKLGDTAITVTEPSKKRDKRNIVKLGDMISVRQPSAQSSKKARSQSHVEDTRSQSSHVDDETNKRSRTGRNVKRRKVYSP